MDPLAPSKTQPTRKTPQSFLGENSGLVNLDQLIKTSAPNTNGQPAYNPFGDLPQQKTNLFQQQMQPVRCEEYNIGYTQPQTFHCLNELILLQVPSINQLKQTPFPVTLSQDPWAPVNSNNANQVSCHSEWVHFNQLNTNTMVLVSS